MTESIIDTSRPSAGRMYDYYLGGNHNFAVDRQVADEVLNLLPFVARFCRLQRWCLQDLAVELTEKRGFDVIIDFASGLPTNDHIHHVVPAGTTVIYSDYDPVVVEYAREILGETNPPNVHFFQADVRRPDELLNRPVVQEILNGRRNVGIVIWGIAGFMPVADLAFIMQTLYDWSGPDSCLAFQAQGVSGNAEDPKMQRLQAIYEQIGSPIFSRSLEETIQLCHPWRVDEPGFVDLLRWHSLDQDTLTPEELAQFGSAGGNYGAYLVK